jgi:uncharacterized small protein (DUF1192 family)
MEPRLTAKQVEEPETLASFTVGELEGLIFALQAELAFRQAKYNRDQGD